MSHDHQHHCPTCSCGSQNVSQGSCHGDVHHHHEHEDFAQTLLDMADDAWMEVLKEKIREQIRTTSGKHLEGLAKLVAESNKERWKHKLEKNRITHDYKTNISDFFHHGE